MFKHGKVDKLEDCPGFLYLPRGFIFRNPEPHDFSLSFLLRRVPTSHPSVRVHADPLKACSHSPVLDWILKATPGGFFGSD